MSRQPRFFVPECPLHVIQRGNNRQAMFVDKDDHLTFLGHFRRAAARHDVAVHAYVLMTNHVHMLATPTAATSVPAMMQQLGRNYVLYFNKRHVRTGTLWEGRYRATVVDSEHYLLACMRYIELNPVRAGLCRDPGRYPWSSYGENAQGVAQPWMTNHPIYRALGATRPACRSTYRALFSDVLPAPLLDRIRDASRYEWALGDAPFREAMEARQPRRAMRLRPGRKREIGTRDE